MSTSMLYHTFGVRGVQYQKTEYFCGQERDSRHLAGG